MWALIRLSASSTTGLAGWRPPASTSPYRGVQRWSWETYWLVGGVFSWIVAPLALAWALVPGFWETLHAAPARTLWWAYAFGVLWGIWAD